MSNINREADKKDFLTTFRKVILAPVSVIPSAFSTSKAAPTTPKPEENPYSGELDMTQTNTLQDLDTAYHGHRISTLSITDDVSRAQSPAPPPTTELAAKAALMNSRLESIRSLFSIEVALNLVHKAKESLERAAQFTQLGGQTGEEAYVSTSPITPLTPPQLISPTAANNAKPSSSRSSKSWARVTSKQVSTKQSRTSHPTTLAPSPRTTPPPASPPSSPSSTSSTSAT